MNKGQTRFPCAIVEINGKVRKVYIFPNEQDMIKHRKMCLDFEALLTARQFFTNKQKKDKTMHGLETIIQLNKSKSTLLIDEAIKNGRVLFNANLNKLVLNFGYTVSMYSIIETKNESKLETAINRMDKRNSFYGLRLGRSGIFYLDSKINVSNKSLAIELGRLWNQRAIYDEEKNETVLL